MVTAADDPNLEKRSDGKTSQLVCWPFPAPCTPGKNNQIINYDATTGHLPHQGDLAANCRRSYGIPYLLLAHNGTAGRDGFRVPPFALVQAAQAWDRRRRSRAGVRTHSLRPRPIYFGRRITRCL
jgi:hypothetical protein